ncbi:MAG: glycosyltransferase [Bacillota bacterium]|nr:glycosyltransferase [Bacillota bacterium]
MSDPLVSICCITYNHEAYIGDAIAGFIGQRLRFACEILIGEDCSTDGTRAVIKSWQDRYPGRIQLVTGDHNIGGRANAMRLRQLARGRYIATCEGDDYWTDPDKLQRQVDALEDNPGCSACFHAVAVVRPGGRPTGRILRPPGMNPEKIYKADEIITLMGGVFHMSSALMRRDYLLDLPDFYRTCKVGDLPLTLVLADRGNFLFLDQVWSHYRVGVPGSAIRRFFGGAAPDPSEALRRSLLEAYEAFDQYSHQRYAAAVAAAMDQVRFQILLGKPDLKVLRREPFRTWFRALSRTERLKTRLRAWCPRLYQIVKRCCHE